MMTTERPERNEDFITLEFEDGFKQECEVLGTFACEGKEYVALASTDGTDEFYLYGYKEMGNEFELRDIEDDFEFKKVAAEFDRILSEAE